MSSGLDPSGPAQPRTADAYTESTNPSTRNPAELEASHHDVRPDETAAAARGPPSGANRGGSEEGVPQAPGRGVHGGGPADRREARDLHFLSHTMRNQRPGNAGTEGEQMATLAEGDVADAVQRRSGTQRAPGQQPHADDYASELDRKKAEQAGPREHVRQQRRAGAELDDAPDKRSGVEVD